MAASRFHFWRLALPSAEEPVAKTEDSETKFQIINERDHIAFMCDCSRTLLKSINYKVTDESLILMYVILENLMDKEKIERCLNKAQREVEAFRRDLECRKTALLKNSRVDGLDSNAEEHNYLPSKTMGSRILPPILGPYQISSKIHSGSHMSLSPLKQDKVPSNFVVSQDVPYFGLSSVYPWFYHHPGFVKSSENSSHFEKINLQDKGHAKDTTPEIPYKLLSPVCSERSSSSSDQVTEIITTKKKETEKPGSQKTKIGSKLKSENERIEYVYGHSIKLLKKFEFGVTNELIYLMYVITENLMDDDKIEKYIFKARIEIEALKRDEECRKNSVQHSNLDSLDS